MTIDCWVAGARSYSDTFCPVIKAHVRDIHVFQIMEVRIVLSCEDGSAQFSERSLILVDGGQVGVARAGGENHPGEDNAVFDCKVGFSFFMIHPFYVCPSRFCPEHRQLSVL